MIYLQACLGQKNGQTNHSWSAEHTLVFLACQGPASYIVFCWSYDQFYYDSHFITNRAGKSIVFNKNDMD